MDNHEAEYRKERNSLENAINLLQAKNEEIIAQKAIQESEKAKLAEEKAVLQMQNHQHIKTIERLENEKVTLAQHCRCPESQEQGEIASQSFPLNQDRGKGSKSASTLKSESSFHPLLPPANERNDDSFPTGGRDATAAKGSSDTMTGGSNTGSYQQHQNRRTNKYRDKKKKAAKDSSKGGITGASPNNHT